MRKAGFIFSLDAFVAFTLTMVTVGMLIFIIGTPQPFYPSLEQAHQLAHDTLAVLATSSDSPGAPGTLTYLERIIKDENEARGIMFRVAGGSDEYPGIIPKGFGYKLERYNFLANAWDAEPLYDAGSDPTSDRRGKNFTKLQASATTFASIYTVPPDPGESPYCYLSCFGYAGAGNYKSPCDAVPCNVSKWNFQQGNNSIQLIRLVVYT
ncbi:MAG: hypothetical protein WCT52_03825 [Candidatus Micrarchaeia archaeon]|jgi:hypothetical protein